MPQSTRTPRRTRRPVERRGELLTAALSVFEEHGYEASSLDDVARAAGVTKGAIYHHFECKSDLLQQAITHRLQENFVAVEALLAGLPGSGAEAKLSAVLQFAWDRWSSPQFERFLGLLGEVGRFVPEAVGVFVREGPRTGWTIVARIVAEGQRDREFRSDIDPHATARLLVSGVVLQALLRRGLTVARMPEANDRATSAGDMTGAEVCEAACAMVRRTPVARTRSTGVPGRGTR